MINLLLNRLNTALLACICTVHFSYQTAVADILVDFSDKSLADNSFFNGGPTVNSNGWTSNGVTFGNTYSIDPVFGGFWEGFAYSNVNDVTTGNFTNQYAAITGTGVGGSGIYAVAYSGASTFINLPSGYLATSVYLTNTTYAHETMRLGDGFSKKFGGVSGTDPDFFRLTLTGYDQLQSPGSAVGSITGQIQFALADFTFADSSLDYLISQWTFVNLSGLGTARSIRFSFDSSDQGPWGINTPTYFALDNLFLTAVPEPSSGLLVLLAASVLMKRRKGDRP